MNNLMTSLSQELRSRRKLVPIKFKSGDTVKVTTQTISSKNKVVEKVFEGVCLRVRRRNTCPRFLLRKVTGDFAVEGHFSDASIVSAKIVKYGVMRQAAPYYLRNLKNKKARIREDFTRKDSK